uniref:Uncharacterized protein n=1 Tax=Anopheles coluzzii TaxID=1518534 RepID=A0A8W7PT82_ANOCL
MRIALLAVASHHAAVVELVFLQETLRIVVRVDVDLGQRVVGGRLHATFVDARLQPRQQQLQPVALLDLLHQLVGRELALHDQDQVLDDVLGAVDVEQAAHDHRQTGRIHLLHVDLDVLLQTVAVQVQHQVVHEIEPIAHNDERQLIRQLRLLQEVLDALRIVAVRLAADALHLLDLVGLAGGLDVLEVHLRILAEVDDRAEEVEQSLVALEALEQVDQRLRRQLLVVLGRDLHADLQILTDVGRQHRLQTLERILHRERAEESHQPVAVQQLGVHDRPLNVVQVGVVLEGALQQAGLLAQLRDVRTVVVREHGVAKDRVRHLRRRHQVHLEQARLQGPLRRAVVLERVEQERRALLHHVLLHEDVHDLVDVGERLLVRHQHAREAGPLLRVGAHHRAQQKHVVRAVVDLLRVQHNLLELARFGEALDHLVRHVRAQVDREGKGRIGRFHQIAELLAALELLLLQPLLAQLLAALRQHRAAQFERFVLVQLALIEQNAEVLQQRRRVRARLGRHLLELLDRLRRAQDALRRDRRHLGRLRKLAVLEQLVKLAHEQILRAGQIVAHRHAQRQVRVLQHRVDVRDDLLLVDRHRQHLALAVNADDAAARFVRRGHKDRVARDAVHPFSEEWRSNILIGVESPSIDQWYTDVSVTSDRVLSVIHFQNTTSSVIVCAFIFDFISMLKICSVFCAFSAITLLAGFMIAESALIGRRIGFCASFMSMITTCAVSPTFSRTQMNLSDSIVRLVNEIELALMLMLRGALL